MSTTIAQPQGEDDYHLDKELGQGAQGVVVSAIVKATGEKVAVKLIKKGDSALDKRLHRELKSNMRLSHPHVARCRNLYVTDEHLAIVLDYANSGNLQEYVRNYGPLPEEEARFFFQQLMLAVDYMHRKDIWHRDIKLENALLHQTPGQKALLLKLSDLGLCRTTDSLQPGGACSMVGTPNYAAPEVLLAEDGRRYDPVMVDAFSCGVFLYVCVFCTYPFERAGEPSHLRHNETLKRMLRCDYSIPDRPNVSEECKDLIRRLIVREPRERASIADVLRHPFFLRNLPHGALDLNNHCISAQQTPQALALAKQREAWVNHIWRQARTAFEQIEIHEPAPCWGSSREASSIACP